MNKKSIIFLMFVLIASQTQGFCQKVEKYSVCFCACTLAQDTQQYTGLRSFERLGTGFILVVNENDLSTRIVDKADCLCGKVKLSALRKARGGSPYFAALDSAEKNKGLLQDAGLTHGYAPQKGIDLTADLCPSSHPLDRTFFTELAQQFGPKERPVPIAIAITGNWMFDHQEDLQWLLSLEKKGDFDITWINHSYNHRTWDSVPVQENFLLNKETNLDVEVLKTERKMIENGLTPSVFFRFPGLVSDSAVFERITLYGLIPVGSDAWLAKNQWPKNGSIVLVHANGNEPYGMKQFFKLIREHRDSINAGTWLLYDLRRSIANPRKAE
jgi:hypothetical protein